MEDTTGALNCRPDGDRIEEVHLERPETRGRAVQGLQVLRLALVLCKNNPPAGASKISCLSRSTTGIDELNEKRGESEAVDIKIGTTGGIGQTAYLNRSDRSGQFVQNAK